MNRLNSSFVRTVSNTMVELSLPGWHDSDDYQAIVSLREEGSDERMVAYEAMPLPPS